MKCKKCGFEAPVISYEKDEKEFIIEIPSWWIDDTKKENDNSGIPVMMCPNCGEVQ